MILTYEDLLEIVEQGVISPVPVEHVNGSSIDVTLGRYIWIEEENGYPVRLKNKEAPRMRQHDLLESKFSLQPDEFVLAQTYETFSLPSTISAEFKLKSSTARSGLTNALATWCDPHWSGSVLTLELKNYNRHHPLVLEMGLKIGQVIFHKGRHVPFEKGYAVRGSYNGDKTAQPSKGVK